MPSQSKKARETQKEYYQGAVRRRRNLLVERGVEKDRIQKDPHLKHLQAELRKTTKRLGTLKALEKKEEELALRKQQKLEAKTEKQPAESPKESKKEQKKPQKKEKKKEEA